MVKSIMIIEVVTYVPTCLFEEHNEHNCLQSPEDGGSMFLRNVGT
jgi:hypothetical protein